MKIIVANSRDFNDYPLLRDKLDKLTYKLKEVLILGRKQDRLGRQWTFERMGTCQIWHEEGIDPMIAAADALIVFGTEKRDKELEALIKLAEKRDLKVRKYGL